MLACRTQAIILAALMKEAFQANVPGTLVLGSSRQFWVVGLAQVRFLKHLQILVGNYLCTSDATHLFHARALLLYRAQKHGVSIVPAVLNAE